jgi:hypothetical protein
MSTPDASKSLIFQFTENLRHIPDLITEGVLQSLDDEDGKLIVLAYSTALRNQFTAISNLIQETEPTLSKERLRSAENLLKLTSGIELTNQVKGLCINLKSNIAKIGLAGLIQMIKKIIKWLIENIFKNLPKWINSLLDLIDEILNEIFGIGSPKLATILSQKEQNYLSELTRLAILNREERYLFDNTEDDE